MPLKGRSIRIVVTMGMPAADYLFCAVTQA